MSDKIDFKESYEKTIKFLSKKKVQNTIAIILLIAILVFGVWIRVQPLPNLIDKTTGEYTPLALDPYYFLRISQTLMETGGHLPEIDSMRYGGLNPGWSKEILPKTTVGLYKIIHAFSKEATLRFADVLNPVIFFALGLLIFFFFIWFLTKNKWIAIVSSFILTIVPPYLYRTLAGFSDHEAIGMVGVFLALLLFTWGLFLLDKKSKPLNLGIVGFIAGFSTMFAIAAWGGGAKFLFMIFPLAFLIRWLVRRKDSLRKNISFYGLWIVGIFVGALFFGYALSGVLRSYMLNFSGILTLVSLIYIIVEGVLRKTETLNDKTKKYQKLISLLITIVIGAIFYQIAVGNVFSMIGHMLKSIIYPFGTARVGLTVAENAQPYLNDLIAQIGKVFYYIFLVGSLIVGWRVSQGIKKKSFRSLFTISFAIFLLGMLYSRISSSSALNGDNGLSKAFFFISFLIFAVSTIYIYSRSDWKIETKWIIIIAWMIPMLLSVRSAIRVFFALMPFMSFMVASAIFETGKIAKKSKDETTRILLWIVFALMIIGIIYISAGHYKTVSYQAKNQHPSYNPDWQNAMSWVRGNTLEGEIFLHWWDYGYWVQTGGERPTVTDGGHFNGYWDHLIGRYVLTTPYPETAKSFMKVHNVSYLLIDPTDIGKYSAYSSIGNNKNSDDRYSFLATFVSNPSEIQETRNGSIRLYRGGIGLDEDISYVQDNKTIFLAKEDSGLGAIILEKANGNYSQPIGIFVKNGIQYRIPFRYLFVNGNFIDFGEGINATAYIYPNLISSSTEQKIDPEGAAMYLSEKSMNSLVAQLYLMNDPLNKYPELELVHKESPYPFIFYYQGINLIVQRGQEFFIIAGFADSFEDCLCSG